MKCELPSNINQLPEFAQEEIRAVWKNYVPGDDCKQELIITDDIIAVLDMLDKDIDRQTPKHENIVAPTEARPDHLTTVFPSRHETLITTRSIETGLTINNTFPTLETIITTTTILPPIIRASDPTTILPNSDDDIDYSDFVSKKKIIFISNFFVFRLLQKKCPKLSPANTLFQSRIIQWKVVNNHLHLLAHHQSRLLLYLKQLLVWFWTMRSRLKKQLQVMLFG